MRSCGSLDAASITRRPTDAKTTTGFGVVGIVCVPPAFGFLISRDCCEIVRRNSSSFALAYSSLFYANASV